MKEVSCSDNKEERDILRLPSISVNSINSACEHNRKETVTSINSFLKNNQKVSSCDVDIISLDKSPTIERRSAISSTTLMLEAVHEHETVFFRKSSSFIKDFSFDWGKQFREVQSSNNSRNSCESSSYSPLEMTEVLSQKLYIGSEDNAWNTNLLQGIGVTHVLCVTGNVNFIKGIEYEHFPMSDYGKTDLDKVLKKVYPFFKRSQEDGKRLFVHCKLGQNRSATVVLGFLMMSKGLSLFEAYAMLKKQRPVVQINKNYAKMLLKLEKDLYNEQSLPNDWMEPKESERVSGVSFKYENITLEEQLAFKSQRVRNMTSNSEK